MHSAKQRMGDVNAEEAKGNKKPPMHRPGKLPRFVRLFLQHCVCVQQIHVTSTWFVLFVEQHFFFFFFKFITRTFSCQIISFDNWIQNKQSLIWNELTELWEDQQHCFSPAFKLGGFLRFAFKHNENRLSWHWSANYKLALLSGCLNVTAETNCLLA